ncbi:MAG TPA: hypothetical protein VEK85_12240 [Gemmatimonadales bacterium]|nr:hypothetical protein [Gemmatimonadales bacterium]
MKRLALAVTAVILSVACRDQQPLQPPARVGPAALIVDGAHGGNADFFFLPPLVPDPSGSPNFNAATFNPNLAPVVEVCVLPGDPRIAAVACGDPPQLVFGPTPLALDASSQQYRVNWDTKSPAPLDVSKFYRMTVRGARRGTPLGTLDLDPVDQGVKNLRTGDVVQFQDGRTLPIRVRIQQGAFGATNSDHVEQVVPSRITTPFLDVTTNTGFAGARFFDGWLPAGFDQVVVIIERVPINNAAGGTSCLQSDLSELEGCYRFRTDPDLHGLGLEGADLTFAVPVIAGVCFEIPGVVGNPDLAPPYGLNRREEIEGVPAGPIVTLEDVPAPFLNCGTFTRTPPPSVLGVIKSGELRKLPGAAWHALLWGVAHVVQPRALNAVDLGAGGSTDGFSRFGWLRSATMTKVLTTDNQIGPTNTALPVDPQVCLTFTHHSESQPLKNEPVTFTVVTGGGTVNGGNSATVSTGTDGCAHASWVLGALPGVNTLKAEALASGSPQIFTATGIAGIDLVNVVLGSTTLAIDGLAVPYTATVVNGTDQTLSSVVLQGWIDQGVASRAAGGLVVVCGAGDGVLPPGTCSFAFTAVASNATAGTGTLVAGPATARFQLLQGGETVLDTFTVPVTLVVPVPLSPGD